MQRGTPEHICSRRRFLALRRDGVVAVLSVLCCLFMLPVLQPNMQCR
jgi:hypothetical protein